MQLGSLGDCFKYLRLLFKRCQKHTDLISHIDHTVNVFDEDSSKNNCKYRETKSFEVIVSPSKHGRHIGIMTPVASSASALSHLWFPIDNC